MCPKCPSCRESVSAALAGRRPLIEKNAGSAEQALFPTNA
jgi:hypothetical protein